eukprot:CAMPEP_0172893936 /NCGR_PEP_ID=MMETSP1075-20121228/149755_1 /TAXON_ID=2916 /ORGANISM="Ceratium fusus, Strain PA161109" /LENGTH=75 /DNA_ID=CAMNT_0013748875 /DNA_START=211 /DNA_END=435 /DNA_ORIENTATION=+
MTARASVGKAFTGRAALMQARLAMACGCLQQAAALDTWIMPQRALWHKSPFCPASTTTQATQPLHERQDRLRIQW